jgi:hypothetical protein
MSLVRWLGSCGLAVSLFLVPSVGSADESIAAAVKRRVEEGLVKPLADKEKERGRFSRARLPPRERRVRITQATATLDRSGREYLAFAVDVRFGEEWRENDIVGCAYAKTGALFVKRGEEYRPAEILLGQNLEPVPGVCVQAKDRS